MWNKEKIVERSPILSASKTFGSICSIQFQFNTHFTGNYFTNSHSYLGNVFQLCAESEKKGSDVEETYSKPFRLRGALGIL